MSEKVELENQLVRRAGARTGGPGWRADSGGGGPEGRGGQDSGGQGWLVWEGMLSCCAHHQGAEARAWC